MTNNKYYPDVAGSPDFPNMEKGVLKAWKKDGTFRKSIDLRSAAAQASKPEQGQKTKNNEYVFYDGPPFANGLPHYGHLLTSCVKDIDARYRTMTGKRVERRFGWDCHGLPAEMESEKELGVSGRKAIEDFGIAKFNDHCRESVMKYTGVWQNDITRAGRWVDFDNDYKTMDTDYMESVLWSFKQLYDKGLIYESHRVMPYSWAAQTPLSNFETRMDDAYRDRTDKAVTVAFKLKEKPKGAPEAENYYLLAWTTTPWTLPSNLALAVGEDMDYSCMTLSSLRAERSNPEKEELDRRVADAPRDDEGDCYILADLSCAQYAKEFNFEEGFKAINIKGSELVGLKYEPLFPYFSEAEGAFKVLAGDFIEEGSGTGVVHLAPGFGEDDQRVCADAGIPVVCPVDEAGCFTDEIFDLPITSSSRGAEGDESEISVDASEKDERDSRLRGNDDVKISLKLQGLNVLEATSSCDAEPYNENQLQKNGLVNLRIVNWLKLTGKLIKVEDYTHSYPHCWRTDKPLIYKAVPSWYVEVTKFRDRMVELNQDINWIPSHIKDGQFGKWLEGARDWSISRNRFWGTPIPIWRGDKGTIKAFGSIKELEEFFGVDVPDLHKPFIDSLTKEVDGETFTRVSDVFDCWFESGAMPFAQVHYPFENKDSFEEHFPADFIVEYIGQTRGWFYTLVVLSTALFDKIPFKNCICHGIILDADGKKLSKRLRNYPDPNEMFDLYGADAMRWRMVKEPVMHGGNLLISKDGSDIRDVVRLSIKPIWNAYSFFTLYANADGIKAYDLLEDFDEDDAATGGVCCGGTHAEGEHGKVNNVMDRYILAKLKQSVKQIDESLDQYLMPEACEAVDEFFEVLNNWYIRRNKERFWKEKKDSDKQAAYDTLYTVLVTMCKAAAPLLPFTLEEIFVGLATPLLTSPRKQGEGQVSVHLQDFPDVSSLNSEENLIAGMDLVRDACNAGLSVRGTENIRVRQPLQKLTIVADGASALNNPDFIELVKDEVNVKEVAFDDDVNSYANYSLKINFPVLGKRLKEEGKADKMKEITIGSKKGEWHVEVYEHAESGAEMLRAIVGEEKIFHDEFTLALEPKEPKGAQALSTNGALVVLDLELTDELTNEGLARDLVRMIQEARKQADLHISDKIELAIEADDGLKEAIEANRDYITEQTLANVLELASTSAYNHSVDNELEGNKVKIGFSVAA